MEKYDPTTKAGVYQIRNTVTGDLYIGSTARSFRVRWAQHRNALNQGKGSRHLNGAWFKHGHASFEFSVLVVCAPADVLMYEQRLIDAVRPTYNLSPTAGNTRGIACSAEKAAKISAAHMGRESTIARVYTVDGITASYVSHARRIGVVGPTLVKDRMKKGWTIDRALKTPKQNSGAWAKTDEGRAKLSALRKGKPANISAENLAARNAKIAAANRVRVITDAHRANASAAQLRRFHQKKEDNAPVD